MPEISTGHPTTITKEFIVKQNEDKHYITADRLQAFIQKAYALSKPQGMGYMHYKAGDLSDDKTKEIIASARFSMDGYCCIDMDYVNGRAVKLTIHKHGLDDWYVEDRNGRWFDHTPELFAELLSVLN